MGEDGFIFYALHRAARRTNANYTLRHLTWTRSHYLTNNPRQNARGGMGWVYPSNATTVVHWLKMGQRLHWNIVHNATSMTSSPAFPAFRFDWHARTQRLGLDEWESRRWERYLTICGMWGCHAPYRGGAVEQFIAAGATLAPEPSRT